MNNLHQRIAPYYKISFVTTSMLEEDLKLIKKLNNLFVKLEKTNKDIYVREIINVLKILNNVIQIEYIISVIYECVDIEFHETLNFVLKKVLEKSNET